jgi:hypothetical protein
MAITCQQRLLTTDLSRYRNVTARALALAIAPGCIVARHFGEVLYFFFKKMTGLFVH